MRDWQVLSLVVSCGVVGCGDEKEGGSASAIDGKKVSELSASETKSLCEWFVERDEKSNISDEQFCTQDAAEYAESSEDCELLRDQCIEELEEEEDESCDDFEVSASCDVTVSALKKCIGDVMDAYAALARKASCDNYEDAILEDPIPSCSKIPESCIEVQITASVAPLRASATSARSLRLR